MIRAALFMTRNTLNGKHLAIRATHALTGKFFLSVDFIGDLTYEIGVLGIHTTSPRSEKRTLMVLFFLGDFILKSSFFLLSFARRNFLLFFRFAAAERFRQVLHVALARRSTRGFGFSLAFRCALAPSALIFRVGGSGVGLRKFFNFYERSRTHVFSDRIPNGVDVKFNRNLR